MVAAGTPGLQQGSNLLRSRMLKVIIFFVFVSSTLTQIMYKPDFKGFKWSGSTTLYRNDLPDARHSPLLCGVLFTPFFCLAFFHVCIHCSIDTIAPLERHDVIIVLIMHSRRSSGAM